MGYSGKSITDVYGRTFGTLRVSLTNTCNLKCMYCVNPLAEVNTEVEHTIANLSKFQLLESIRSIHRITPLHTIRLTGGEPTLYKELVGFVQGLKEMGIPHIKMTTNGALLSILVKDLISAGLSEVNISLDALDAQEFYKVTGRKNVQKTMQAIEVALQNQLKVKINAVILKGINDNQILPLMRFGKAHHVSVRFLELMKMGHLFSSDFGDLFFSQHQMLERIRGEYTVEPISRKKGSTANYWKDSENYVFGIIANESTPFCMDCDRLRMDQTGRIYGCLSEATGYDISHALKNEIALGTILHSALMQKQEKQFTGSKISMIDIGG